MADAGFPTPGYSGIPSSRYPGYVPPESNGVENVQPDQMLTEADVEAAVGAGAVIRRVLVVEQAATGALIACLKLSSRAGWFLVALRRKEGAKTWRDWRTLRRTLGSSLWGYRGPIFVYPEGHPYPARLGISLT